MNQLITPIPRPLDGVPNRFAPRPATRQAAIEEIDKIAAILWHGSRQLSGLYMRMCDLIRDNDLSENEIRAVLGRHFPPPRVSEFIKVANAPDEVYRRYQAGFFGFKAALQECRGYHVTPAPRLAKRRIQRAALRLVQLTGGGTFKVSRWKIQIEQAA